MKLKKRILIFVIIFITTINIISPSVFALTEKFALTFSGSQNGNEVRIVLKISENTGISAASLTLIFDSSILKYNGFEYGNGLDADVKSVVLLTDSAVSFKFLKTNGFVRSKGDFLILKFTPLKTGTAQITAVYENNAVYGLFYTPISYTASILSLNVTAAALKAAAGITINRQNMTITGFAEKIDINSLKNFLTGEYTVLQSTGYIKTGTEIKAAENGKIIVFKLIVKGDVNCDGMITPLDYYTLRLHILKLSLMKEVAEAAADCNSDGLINAIDYVRIRLYLLNMSKL